MKENLATTTKASTNKWTNIKYSGEKKFLCFPYASLIIRRKTMFEIEE